MGGRWRERERGRCMCVFLVGDGRMRVIKDKDKDNNKEAKESTKEERWWVNGAASVCVRLHSHFPQFFL